MAELVFNALTKAVPVQYNELLGVYYNENQGIIYSLEFNYLQTLGYKNFDLVYKTNENTDYGRPGIIRLAVLVDRGSPEFPIRADYVGFACNPPADHKVAVRFDDDDSAESGIYEVEWK